MLTNSFGNGKYASKLMRGYYIRCCGIIGVPSLQRCKAGAFCCSDAFPYRILANCTRRLDKLRRVEPVNMSHANHVQYLEGASSYLWWRRRTIPGASAARRCNHCHITVGICCITTPPPSSSFACCHGRRHFKVS